MVERLESAELLRLNGRNDVTNSVQDELATENVTDPEFFRSDEDDVCVGITVSDSPSESESISEFPELPLTTEEFQRSKLRKQKLKKRKNSSKRPAEAMDDGSTSDSSDSDEELGDEATDENESECVVKKRRRIQHEKKSPNENRPTRDKKPPNGKINKTSQVYLPPIDVAFMDFYDLPEKVVTTPKPSPFVQTGPEEYLYKGKFKVFYRDGAFICDLCSSRRKLRQRIAEHINAAHIPRSGKLS